MNLKRRPAEPVASHGMDGLTEAPVWPAVQTGDLHVLAAHFPVLHGPFLIDWHSPRPFSSAAVVQAARAAYFVKRHDLRVRDAASIAEEHRFLAHLRARGFPAAEPLVTVDGAAAIEHEGGCFEVQALAAGVDAYRGAHSWTPVRSLAHAQSLGHALARLHLAAKGYDAPARAPRPLLAGTELLAAADPSAALDRFVAGRPALARFLEGEDRAWRGHLLEVIAPLHARLQPLWPALEPLWIHNDWHASNLFWTDRSEGAGVRAAIDFGLCNRGCAMIDLATALERNTIEWLRYRDPAAAPGAGRIEPASVGEGLWPLAAGRPGLWAIDDPRRERRPDWVGRAAALGKEAGRSVALGNEAGRSDRRPGESGRADSRPNEIGRPELACALVEAYLRVRHVSAAERAALPLLLALAHVEFALAEADYFAGVLGRVDHARRAYPDFTLGHVRWFASRPGRDYLDALLAVFRV